MADMNFIFRLPDGFTQLLNLTQLYLNDTFLDYLPGNFGRYELVIESTKYAALLENWSLRFPTRSDTNRSVHPQKKARGLKFWIKEEELYYQ